MRTWCKDHPILFMAYYLVFYLIFFNLLEKSILVPDLVLHCALDDMIPFCKYAIIPYNLWFAWIPCTLYYLLSFNDRPAIWRLCLPRAGADRQLLNRGPLPPCVHLGHAGAGLSPLRPAAGPQVAVGQDLRRRAVCGHHSFHPAAQAALGD